MNQNQKIRIEHIQDGARLESMQTVWEDLHQNSPIRDVFLTWEWFSAWWKHYHLNKDLWLVAAWQGDTLVGLAPLMRVRKQKYGITFRVLMPLSATDCDVSGFLIRNGDESVVAALCEFIIQRRSEWDVIQLSEIEQNLPQTQTMIIAFQKAGYEIYQTPTRHYYLPVNGTWDDFFNQLPKKLRQNLQRRQRRAEETGTILYTCVKGSEVTWDHFLTIFEINKTGNFPDLYRSEKDQQFHRAIMERMQEGGWIEIHILSLNGEALAYQYGFEMNGRYEDWRRGFSQSYPQLSTGKMLMGMTLEHQFKSGYREVDFLRGVHEYKTDWKPVAREYLKINVIPPQNIKASLAFLLLPRIKNWIKKIIRSRKNESRNSKKANESESKNQSE